MSRIYDNWEKLVGAVLKREELRRLALCESFSSSNFSSRPSFDSTDPAASSSLSISISHNIMAIQFEEIKLATQNFQPDMLLGEGRYGPVYKGWIHEHFLTAVKPGSGIAVAVKMLNKEGFQCGMFSWSQPHHPNLVKFIGYSFEEGNWVLVLVYEFMPNGSLDNHLFTRGHQLLSWETRVQVAIGAARGLSFFHDSAITVTHEGVNCSSILLDDEVNAHFSDFDLTTASSLTHIISTPDRKDYAAPEYIASDRLTMKSDVYSFGIILLELLSGLRVCDKNRPIKEQNLVVWAKPYLMNKRKLLQIVDSRLEGQYPHDGAYKICKLASQCLRFDPKLRPRMTEVVDALEQLSSSLSTGSRYHQNPSELPSGIDGQMDQAGWSRLSVLGTDSENSSTTFGPVDPSNQSISGLHNAMAIKLEVIKRATRNFRPDLLLGEGRSGPVFKGVINEHPLTAVKHEFGIIVAVRKLNLERVVGSRQCLNEIHNLSKLRHPNLVRLIGYCFEADNKILVYEFVPRGSLDYHLFGDGQSLLWERRLKVAVGAARALAFLHASKRPAMYRCFNSGNILLDNEFNAKLSGYDLGIVSWNGSVKVGYEPPEYAAKGQLYLKSDVYSFGVVLLELLSGYPAYDRTRRNLVEWSKPHLESERKVSRIMDPKLEGRSLLKGAYKVAQLASHCLSLEHRLRPSMAEVVVALEQLSVEKYVIHPNFVAL